MKVTTCVSLLLATVVCLAKADTNYFEKPAEGSKFQMCTKVEFLLDRVGNDDDKVLLAKLFKDERVQASSEPAAATPRKKPSPPPPPAVDTPVSPPAAKQRAKVATHHKKGGKSKPASRQKGNATREKRDVDPTVKSTFVSLLQTWRGGDLDDVSDINFFWVIPTNLTEGDYHVAMEITRIDELNEPPEPGRDAGDISDPVRSYTFTILPAPANKTLCAKV
ncbi:hypothetical protein BX666DRAFT_1942608 [Dichotomocladium elegans]|nr:hypothetical protein BX666DRAFT_1942608 [Dichotomocladium elegans]